VLITFSKFFNYIYVISFSKNFIIKREGIIMEKDFCIYCGVVFNRIKKERDHIPSKALFPEGKSITKPIIIPSCSKCNRSFSKDEEYFRNFLLNPSESKSFIASQLFNTKLKRSIQRRPSIGFKELKRMKLVNFYSNGGIYLGKRTRIKISNEDWKRYFNVLDKYIKGLYYHHLKSRLEDRGFVIKHSWLEPENIEPKLLKTITWNTDNEAVFIYGYSFVKETNQAIFITVFYENICFISLVASKENFKKFKKSRK
jgi:hypothetical protein